ncbi:hypothetical protein GTY86_16455 [Streptomyces sp. SID5770]|nr:hypothetical protein [Streptomyces sp. SID5770]
MGGSVRLHPSARLRPSARLLRGALTAGVALGLSATVLSSPARAADGWDRCPQGSVCGFSKPLYQGDMLVIRKPMGSLGSWDNRIRSFVNRLSGPGDAVCFFPKAGLDPEGSTHFYTSASFDESAFPELDRAVSSVDVGPEADDFCGSESRFPMLWDAVEHRPATLPAHGAFGDLDRDGYADVLSRNMLGQLWTTPSYESSHRPLLVGGWEGMTKLARHGDYDGDGDEDVFARDKAGVLWFHPGNGKGYFKPRVKIGGGWNSMKELKAVADITGDGRRDLVARDTAGVLWTYPGNGKGWFGARTKVGGGWNAMTRLVAPGDMNGDGRSDLVARDNARGLWLYPGNGKGAFGARTKLSYSWPSDAPVFSVGDVTGDGKADVMRPIDGQQLYVYVGNGRGGIGGPQADMSWDSAERVHVF